MAIRVLECDFDITVEKILPNTKYFPCAAGNLFVSILHRNPKRKNMELNGKVIKKKMNSMEMCDLAMRMADMVCANTSTQAEAAMVVSHMQLVLQAHILKGLGVTGK